jgi:hypothetical protein
MHQRYCTAPRTYNSQKITIKAKLSMYLYWCRCCFHMLMLPCMPPLLQLAPPPQSPDQWLPPHLLFSVKSLMRKVALIMMSLRGYTAAPPVFPPCSHCWYIWRLRGTTRDINPGEEGRKVGQQCSRPGFWSVQLRCQTTFGALSLVCLQVVCSYT